jgi:hypothetical protein
MMASFSDKYNTFQAEDFAEDENFVRWVKHPGNPVDGLWQEWLKANPDRLAVVEEAR